MISKKDKKDEVNENILSVSHKINISGSSSQFKKYNKIQFINELKSKNFYSNVYISRNHPGGHSNLYIPIYMCIYKGYKGYKDKCDTTLGNIDEVINELFPDEHCEILADIAKNNSHLFIQIHGNIFI